MDRYRQTANGTAMKAVTQGYDPDLASFMGGAFLHLGCGLALTAATAVGINMAGAVDEATHGLVGIAILFLPLVIVIAMGLGSRRFGPAATGTLFYFLAAAMGAGLSGLSLRYDLHSILLAAFSSAAGFLGICVWSLTTRRDVSGLGVFAVSGLVGLVAASFVNIFIGSPAIDWAISLATVAVMSILTAFDVQRLRSVYLSGSAGGLSGTTAIHGALSLYLDFINLFLAILRLTGRRS